MVRTWGKRLALVLTIGVLASTASAPPALADATPVHGQIRIEIGEQPGVTVSPSTNPEFDAVGAVTGTVNNTDIDPTTCAVHAAPGAGIGAAALTVGGCADSSLALTATADLSRGAAAGSLTGSFGDTGTGPVVSASCLIILIIIAGPVIIIIIIF
jgi:hypothetical protein